MKQIPKQSIILIGGDKDADDLVSAKLTLYISRYRPIPQYKFLHDR